MSEWGCFAVLFFVYAVFGAILYLLSPIVAAVYIVTMPVIGVCFWKWGRPL